jgi:hypothetical protein
MASQVIEFNVSYINVVMSQDGTQVVSTSYEDPLRFRIYLGGQLKTGH